MRDLQLISLWEAKRSAHSYINYHSHNYHELVYYHTGGGVTQIGAETFSFSDHCLAVIPSHTEHNETHHTSAEVICLEIAGAPTLQLGFYDDSSRTIHKILMDLLSEVKQQAYGYEEMLAIKLNELLVHIARQQHSAPATKNFDYMINYIRENFHERVNLSDCARQLNISYDYFQHKFKRLTGYSPRQFLMNQRLLAGAAMLKNSSFNCTEIAYRCGFCTSAQFTALFKKRYGLSPLQFKKQHKEKA